MRQVIQECTHLVLKMVEWKAGDESGGYIKEDALGGHDDTPLVNLSEESRAKISEIEPTPEKVGKFGEEGENVALGGYFEMSPRGRIELYWERIGSFFWHIAANMLSHHKITAYLSYPAWPRQPSPKPPYTKCSTIKRMY